MAARARKIRTTSLFCSMQPPLCHNFHKVVCHFVHRCFVFSGLYVVKEPRHGLHTRYITTTSARVTANLKCSAFNSYLSCLCLSRVEDRSKAKRRKDEADLSAGGSGRTGSGTVQRPDHCWECCEERPDGGKGCHRQQNDQLRVQAAAGIW